MCPVVSPRGAVSEALVIPLLSQRAGLCLAVRCRRCDRELQLRPCRLGAGAEGAFHMSHMLHACLRMPAWCFHSSRTFLTLTQLAVVFCAAVITPDVSHLAFVQLIIPTYRSPCICLSDLPPLSFFFSFPDYFSTIIFNFDPNFLQLPCSPSQPDTICKFNVHSLFPWSSQKCNTDWCQIQHRSQRKPS